MPCWWDGGYIPNRVLVVVQERESGLGLSLVMRRTEPGGSMEKGSENVLQGATVGSPVLRKR